MPKEFLKALINLNLSQDKINEYLKEASNKEDSGLITFLLSEKALKNNADIHYDNDYCLINACWQGNLKMVRILLTSPNLNEYSDINARNGMPLQVACAGSHLHIVKFLLTNPLLKEKCNVTIDKDVAFRTAAFKGHEKIVEFLITNASCSNININNCNDYAFKMAAEKKHMNICKILLENSKNDSIFDVIGKDNNIDILEKLIFEHDLKKTRLFDYYLNSTTNDYARINKDGIIVTEKNKMPYNDKIRSVEYPFIVNKDLINKMFEIRNLDNSMSKKEDKPISKMKI